MSRIPLSLAIRDYAHVAPLAMGDVTIEGVDLTLRRTFDAPQQSISDPALDGGEASFSRHLQRIAAGDESFVGLPAFVLRGFRHRCIFVRRDSMIADLTDLVGRRVGLNEWGATGHTWMRSAFRERGIWPEDVRWVVGRISPGAPPPPATPFPEFVEAAAPHTSLTQLLLQGRLDALLASEPPEGFTPTDGPIVRLFRDFRVVERAYYARTGIYPSHHNVVLRRAIVDEYPWLPRSVFAALEESRRRSADARRLLGDVSPWLLAELEETEGLMGSDAGAYGIEPNARMIATFCEEQHAQGLVSTPIDPSAAFAGFTSRQPVSCGDL